MTIRDQLNRSGGFRPNAQGKPSSLILIIATLAIVLIIASVFVGAAIGLGNRGPAAALITVPGDYSTIQAAIDAAKPGDIIQVQTGTYRENLNLDKPVTLTAESFDQVNPTNNGTIIDGIGGGATIQIPAGLSEMPTIRGFAIQSGSAGIQAQSEFIAEFNYLHGPGILTDYQMGSGGSNHDNVFFKAGSDSIHLDRTNRSLLIENDRILYSGEDGIEINLEEASSPPTPIEIDITNNMLIGSVEDGIQFVDQAGKPADTSRRFVVLGNLIANNTRAGIGLMPDGKTIEDYSGAQVAEPVRAYDNTFYGNDYGISGGGNLVAFNNIIAGSTARGVWKLQGPQGSNAVIAYTLFFGNTLDSDQSTLGAGNILGQDPRFVAPPNPGPDGAWQTLDDDFSGLVLRADSPAIDKGVTQYTTQNAEHVPPVPISGYVGAAPDLGWREYGSPIFETPTPSVVPSPSPVPSATPLSSTAPFTATSTPVTTTPAPTSLSPTVPPATATVVSRTPTATVTPAATSTTTAQLSIQSVTPTEAAANATVTITITGAGFASGAAVAFYGGQGPAPQVMSVQVVSSTTILALVSTKSDGPSAETWNLRVTDPDGASAVLMDAFTVTP